MLSILIVNWNGKKYVNGCFSSIREKVSGPHEVIVVDNHSTDGSPELIAEQFPWVKLIRSSTNLGFGKGNNLAAQHATGQTFLLLNLDTELLIDPGPIVSALAEDQTIGCVGSRMCNGAGAIVANCGHFPSPLRLLLFSSMFWRPYKGQYGPASMQAQRVDWVEGSWVLIPRKVWDAVGGFDDRIFMYGEDVDLCRSINEKGYKVVHVPSVAYLHHVGWSVHRLPYQFAGSRFYHRKHSAFLQRILAETVLYVGLKVRLVWYVTLGWLTQKASFKEKQKALRQVERLWSRFAEPGFGLQ